MNTTKFVPEITMTTMTLILVFHLRLHDADNAVDNGLIASISHSLITVNQPETSVVL